jgi:hypothetical protein
MVTVGHGHSPVGEETFDVFSALDGPTKSCNWLTSIHRIDCSAKKAEVGFKIFPKFVGNVDLKDGIPHFTVTTVEADVAIGVEKTS